MSDDSFIILDEDVNSKRYKQFLSDKKRYKALMLTFLENTKLNNRYTRLTALELKNKTLEYYTLLSESDKQIFSTYYDNFLMQYIAKFTAPIEIDFEEFKTILESVRNNTFWDKIDAKNELFETNSNEEFFNYVMKYFKDDIILYKKVVFSYMFQRMLRIFSGKTALYMLYINEHYNDFTPLTKILSASKINKGYDRLDARNFLFNKAMKNWNEENPLFKKKFKPIKEDN
tara:strand:+ start:44 stop:733 length:690 start_codon:yes stop_codon:yes gene_type:complete